MRPIIKFIACLFCVFMVSVTALQAQGVVAVTFKDSDSTLIIDKEEILRIDFVYKSSIIESYGISDTVFLNASAGRDSYLGTIHSGEPVRAESDCEWLKAKLVLDTISSSSTDYYYDYYFYAEKNISKEPRVGRVNLISGTCVKEKIVFQRGYNSSFVSSMSERWDEDSVVKQETLEFEWCDTVVYAYFIPNFGLILKEKPEWVKEVRIYNAGDVETDDLSKINTYGTVAIKFDKNIALSSRYGHIVLSDYYDETLVINLTQNKLNCNTILNQMNAIQTLAGSHYEWGYGSLMHIRDVMTSDMTVVATGYDWYSPWGENRGQGENFANTQYVWNFHRDMLYQINKTIEACETMGDKAVAEKAVAYAYRALIYLDWAQMIEFLPNEVTSPITEAGNDVTNYTVPIVKGVVSPRDTIEVPRATREEMAEFILSDLAVAESCVVNLNDDSKELPHLDAVYGLKARYYMWLGDYANAKKYARLSIDNNTGYVMSEDECLNIATGFNTATPWMWASTTQKEDDVVENGILNWVSWMSPEAQYGYSAVGATSMIDAAMYARISDTDFRKLMFKAPAGHALEAKVPYIDAAWGAELPEYAAIKFRPNEGNTQEYWVGSSTSYPLMRVEEMYFIEAEAAEHLVPGEGIALLTEFMVNNRDANYTVAADVDAIDEIVFQKRVELWGEGQSFYDYKRLNMSVTRAYEGTNVDYRRRFNTTGRPAWMNFCIVVTAKATNPALKGWENPDPSGLYQLNE